jgi:hypothetical protein
MRLSAAARQIWTEFWIGPGRSHPHVDHFPAFVSRQPANQANRNQSRLLTFGFRLAISASPGGWLALGNRYLTTWPELPI